MQQTQSPDELYHYGKLGMKWGVRNNVDKAYSKATNKQNKLNAKADKARAKYLKAQQKANSGVSIKYKKLQAKADKLQAKADKKKYGLFRNENKAAKLQVKADKAQYKADKIRYKAEKREANASLANGKYLRAQRKAEKWTKAMNKEFSQKTLIQLQDKYNKKGASYVNKALKSGNSNTQDKLLNEAEKSLDKSLQYKNMRQKLYG